MCGLQSRGHITQCFRLFHVVVEGPKGLLLLVAFSSDVWWGSWGPRICPNFRLWDMPVYMHNASFRARMCLLDRPFSLIKVIPAVSQDQSNPCCVTDQSNAAVIPAVSLIKLIPAVSQIKVLPAVSHDQSNARCFTDQGNPRCFSDQSNPHCVTD